MKEKSIQFFITIKLIDSVFKMGKNYYPQVFLKCKQIVKEKEVTRHITE